MCREFRIEVQHALRTGSNVLRIDIQPAIAAAKLRADAHPYEVPAQQVRHLSPERYRCWNRSGALSIRHQAHPELDISLVHILCVQDCKELHHWLAIVSNCRLACATACSYYLCKPLLLACRVRAWQPT